MKTAKLRAILAEEGLQKLASMSDAEFWSIINRYLGATSEGARKKVTQGLMEEFAKTHGPSIEEWKKFAATFEEQLYKKGMKIQDALYRWYEKQPKGTHLPSDSTFRMLGYTLTLFGEATYKQVMAHPETLPKQSGHSFSWYLGTHPQVTAKFLNSRSTISEYTDLMYPYASTGFKWPRGWK